MIHIILKLDFIKFYMVIHVFSTFKPYLNNLISHHKELITETD